MSGSVSAQKDRSDQRDSMTSSSVSALCFCDCGTPTFAFWDYWPEQVLFTARVAELPSKIRQSVPSSDKR